MVFEKRYNINMIKIVAKTNQSYLLIGLALTALSYWLVGELAVLFTLPKQLFSLISPASGIAVALLLIFGIRLWPAILLGALWLAYSIFGYTLIAISLAIGNILEVVVVFYILKYLVELEFTLKRARDLVGIVLIGAGAGGLMHAVIGTLTLLAGRVISSDIWLTTFLHLWMADSLGYLLFTPLLLTLYANRNLAITYKLEISGLILLALSSCYLAFFSKESITLFNVIGLYLIFPCAIWAAYRFYQRGSIFITFVISMIIIWSVANQRGFFASKNIMIADEYWFFVATLCLSGLTLAIIHTNRLAAEEVLTEMIESVNAIIWRATADFEFIYVSKEAVEILGFPVAEWTENHQFWIDHLHEEDRLWLPSYCREQAIHHSSFIVDYRMTAADGRLVWLQNNIKVKRNIHGRISDLLGVMVDITERKKSELSLNLYKQACERLEEGLVITDAAFNVVEANRGHTRITGLSRREVIGYPSVIIQSALLEKQRDKNVLQVLEKTGRWAGEVWCSRKNGETYPNWVSITTIRGQFEIIDHYIAVFSDISERKKSETNLQFLATHDVLTNLPNRTLLRERLDFSLLRASRNKNKIAIFFVDLDRFKNINDTLGHHVGDDLLQAVAKRLKACFRLSDTVARQGGDEFVILIDEFIDTNYLMGLAEKLMLMLQAPYDLDEHELHVTASIGISIYPDDGEDASMLLKHADVAMYRAKSNGKNVYSFYSAQANISVSSRLSLENSLRRAVIRHQLVLHYQPKYDLVLERVVGAEALVRWQHPDLGLLYPDTFIDIAEETGLIVEIGNWVIQEACKQGVLWQALVDWPVKVSVNLSARQFTDSDLLSDISNALKTSGLPADCLDLEITESLIMQRPEDAIKVLQHFRDLGTHVSIDDFGTGYSSLGYLKRLPIDTLKIDRTFIKDIPVDADDMAITQAVITLAHNMQVTVVAEGVETQAQWDFLKRYSCDQIQGYYYSKPLTAEDFMTFLAMEKTKKMVKFKPSI